MFDHDSMDDEGSGGDNFDLIAKIMDQLKDKMGTPDSSELESVLGRKPDMTIIAGGSKDSSTDPAEALKMLLSGGMDEDEDKGDDEGSLMAQLAALKMGK